MKNLLIVSKVKKRLTPMICVDKTMGKKLFELNFEPGIPIEVPEEYALPLLKTYPMIYSKSKLTKAEVAKLAKEPVVEKVEEVVVEEPVVDPFKDGIPKEEVTEETTEEEAKIGPVGQRYPITKTNHEKGALLAMYNKDLVVIYRSNVGQDIAENTRKEDLVEMITRAQAE